MGLWQTARQFGETFLTSSHAAAQAKALHGITSAIGLQDNPPPPCMDPDLSYMPVDGAAREIHADLPAMLIGGLASLLFQMTHPYAMAGVGDFSNYQADPLGRLYQTAQFIGVTTFGSRNDAYHVIETVNAVHAGVRGTAPDGVAYSANDPHLLLWVHAAETAMFLRAAETYGPTSLASERADQYVAEMAVVARDLGVLSPPTTRAELMTCLQDFEPELRLIPAGVIARDFVVRGVSTKPHERAAYATLVSAAINLLPPHARRTLGIPRLPLAEDIVIRPIALGMCVTLRFATDALKTT